MRRPCTDPTVAAEGPAVLPAPSAGATDPLPSWAYSGQRAHERASHAARVRNACLRRRFVDPAPCERDYSAAEMEFLQAIQEYQQRSGRMFPTWSEVLKVVQELGYVKVERRA